MTRNDAVPSESRRERRKRRTRESLLEAAFVLVSDRGIEAVWGAMYLAGSATLLDSTIQGNLATANAPAVYVSVGGTFTFENTTIRDNGGSGQTNKPVIRIRPNGVVTCVTSELFGNTRALTLETDATASFDDCDFVDPVTKVGNGPADIEFGNAPDLIDIGHGFTATCDVNGCVEP